MINQKYVQRVLYGIKKGVEIFYFICSLWFGLLLILTIPLWAPIYLFTTSMCRSINFFKRIIDLPNELFLSKRTQPIRYAILKGNGKYLRNTGQQDAFLYQLYDYTMRKFLSLQSIKPHTKIAQIQCQTLSQWKFFKSNQDYLLKNISCLNQNTQILQKQKQSFQQIQIKQQKYNIEQFSNQYDIIISLNLKEKLNKYHSLKNQDKQTQKIDILKILSYIRHHLSQNGYAIFGDFFEQQGEVSVLQQLFSIYGFKIEQTENIQKNISYAQKIRTYKIKKHWEQQLLDKIIKKGRQLFKLNRDYNKKYFIVFILTKNNENKNQ